MTKLKIFEVLVGVDVGEFKSALWYAVMQTPLLDNDAQIMVNNNRANEIVRLGERWHWVMGRIDNPKYITPYTIVEALAKEVDGKMPSITSKEEYRFKVIRV